MEQCSTIRYFLSNMIQNFAKCFFLLILIKKKDMLKYFVAAMLLVTIFGCKKNGDDDITTYRWKRDLYRARVHSEGPAVFYSKDPNVSGNQDAIFLSSSFVILTEHRRNIQQDSIYNASGRTQIYKYGKVDD